jgi:hypothetical protein
MCILPTKYIDKLVKNYEKLFGMKPNTSVTSPLEKGDHQELDTSELCTTDQIAQYQSMIGTLQWIVTIGRFDINTAVMTLSGLLNGKMTKVSMIIITTKLVRSRLFQRKRTVK